MQLEIVNSGVPLDEPLREYIAERLHAAMGTVEKKTQSVTVRIGETPANGEALKFHCAVTVRLNRGETITSVDLGDQLRPTIDRVVDEVVSAVEKQIGLRWW